MQRHFHDSSEMWHQQAEILQPLCLQNKPVTELFGWSQSEMQGKNVNSEWRN